MNFSNPLTCREESCGANFALLEPGIHGQADGPPIRGAKGFKKAFREPSAACIFNKLPPPKHFENESLIYVRVVDSGPGVPDSIRETLFQPFVRDGKPHGTGLGPAIAECTARDHGGSANPEESTFGNTVFTLYLPKVAMEAQY
jgi:signal transduction histidine kinase